MHQITIELLAFVVQIVAGSSVNGAVDATTAEHRSALEPHITRGGERNCCTMLNQGH
jgi:hypothetical protein